MQFLKQFHGGGIFLEANSKNDAKKERKIAIAVFLGSILCVYLLFGDFLSIKMFKETECVQGNNTCASGEICASLWVKCNDQTQSYKYDPITTLLFGKKKCATPTMLRSICISEKKYDEISLNLTIS